MGHFAVSAIGRDRPGIVAAIAEGLLAVEGNVEDSRMTILGGHFAVMLLVATGDEHGRPEIEAALSGAREQLELEALTVSEIGDVGAARPAPDHVITVYGSDHPGIVHAIGAELAAAGVNVTDLQTRLAGGEDTPVYVMTAEVELGEQAAEQLRERLRDVGVRASVEVQLRPLDADAL
ncbi:MAG: ACT domain-containing protein [Solirubrobacterales bacterium]|nr:ACT domain-containing protein [Solirubrobacterales bacterium]